MENVKFTEPSLPSLSTSDSSNARLTREWALDYIREIQKKSIFQKRTALEIYLVDGTSLLFNFPEGELEEVSQKIVRMRKTRCPNLVYYGSLDPKKILEKANITKKWQSRQLTNFEYLMWLNSLSGRSFNDLTQYPIFPWVLSNYSSDSINLSDSQIYRDLAKAKESSVQASQASGTDAQPVGNTRMKKKIMISLPDDNQGTPTQEVSGSCASPVWYCSPSSVVQFLQNLEPYSENLIMLHDKGIKVSGNQ